MDEYYNKIKNELINNEIVHKIKDYSKNKSDLSTYYNVGEILSEAGKHYGEGIIKKYSIKLTNELDKKYSYRSLNYMLKFYKLQNLQSMTAQLSWSHYCELLSLISINEITYYIKIVELKITELKKEHIGQIETYMNYIDKNVKNINHDNTIGIIICKKDNKYIIEYCSDKRIISREYLLIQ